MDNKENNKTEAYTRYLNNMSFDDLEHHAEICANILHTFHKIEEKISTVSDIKRDCKLALKIYRNKGLTR